MSKVKIVEFYMAVDMVNEELVEKELNVIGHRGETLRLLEGR